MGAEDEVDVVVVGAGVAGLSAAYQLWKKDHSIRIIVFEAKERVGGRTLTVKLPAAEGEDDFDLGGQWVGSCQPDITTLLEELGIERCRQFTTGTKCMQLGKDSEVKYYNTGLPGLSFLTLIDMFFLTRKIEKLCQMVPVDNPTECLYAEEWDSMTAESFARKQAWTQGALDAMQSASACIFGRLPKDMSFLYFLHYCHAAGGLQALIQAQENSAQEFTMKGGAQQVAQRLMEKIGPENVHLGQPVRSITQNENMVLVETMSGRSVKCKRVIVATPPKMAGYIHYDPPLPANKTEIFQRMPAGYLIKVIVTYKKAFWREAGFSGEIVTHGGKSIIAGCTSGPLCIVYDATTINDNPALVMFIGAKQGVEWAQEPLEVRKKAVLNNLAECLGEEALDCVHYMDKNWAEEPYNGGCPVSTVMPGAMTCFAGGLRDPFQRIHFAGTESATVWCGFINGAVQSGTRAANEVLYHIRPQTITDEDLQSTIYAPKSSKLVPNKKPRRKQTLIKWTLGIGAVLVAVYAGMKSMSKSSG